MKPIQREYKVGHIRNQDSKQITAYFVTDAHNNKEIDLRPQLISFPVSVLYPEQDQEQRAQEYADYMNKIVCATMQAYENNNLMDILKEKSNG
jgi:hypothetical protein